MKIMQRITISIFGLLLIGSASAAAATIPSLIPSAPDINAKGYVLLDANSGHIIAQKNADTRMPPASLTKLMTLYITAAALQNGQTNINDQVRISKNAWQVGGSRMFVKENSLVPLQLLIQGIIVASGNDKAAKADTEDHVA